MQDSSTYKVILNKVVRRKGFILGKSIALNRVDVALMDDGTLRVIFDRRSDYFREGVPLNTCSILRGESEMSRAVKWMRTMEADYITAELPEVSAR
ncbi:hypothetical protein ACFV0H_28380 [Streptomyces erythrochromogenes]|uniref:hypothetical protein n=1 Tax=Streptomyces erythrochromogenes TaxID=285574 RepID=UPI0036C43E31